MSDLPWKSPSDTKGKIRFEIVKKEPGKNGSICYVIRVSEIFGDFSDGILIQEYSGFYNRQKDKFILISPKSQKSIFP